MRSVSEAFRWTPRRAAGTRGAFWSSWCDERTGCRRHLPCRAGDGGFFRRPSYLVAGNADAVARCRFEVDFAFRAVEVGAGLVVAHELHFRCRLQWIWDRVRRLRFGRRCSCRSGCGRVPDCIASGRLRSPVRVRCCWNALLLRCFVTDSKVLVATCFAVCVQAFALTAGVPDGEAVRSSL